MSSCSLADDSEITGTCRTIVESMSNLAVSYAAVILADADVEITADKLLTLTKEAKVEDVEPIFAQLYAKALAQADKKELLTAFGATAAPAAGGEAAGDAAAAEEAPKEEAKKEESESDSDMDMGMLF